jgi:hypothetical protein
VIFGNCAQTFWTIFLAALYTISWSRIDRSKSYEIVPEDMQRMAGTEELSE